MFRAIIQINFLLACAKEQSIDDAARNEEGNQNKVLIIVILTVQKHEEASLEKKSHIARYTYN